MNAINTKKSVICFCYCFQNQKIYNYWFLDINVIKHMIFHRIYFKSHVQKVFLNNFCILMTIQIIK
jgi:hypothetical protein